MKIFYPFILLTLIILLALFFRLYGMNWDKGCCMHPDERAIIMATIPLTFPNSFEEFMSSSSPLNPHFFAYGSFPIYVLTGISFVVGQFDISFTTYEKINLLGRILSTTADLGTIIILFFIGKKLINKALGLLSSFFYALAVLPIQNAHFFTVDLLLTFFTTATLYSLLLFYKSPSSKKTVIVGICFGGALATKISALPLAIIILITLLGDFFIIVLKNIHKLSIFLPHIPHALKALLIDGLIIFLATIFTFSLLQPYAIIDFSEFLHQNQIQSQMTRDAFVFPYTLQYVGITPYIYQLKNIFLWGLGPVLFLFSIVGFICFVIKIFRKSKKEIITSELIFLTFFVVYFGIVGSFAVGWMRYMLPLYPLFCLFGAVGVTLLFYPLTKHLITRFFPLKINLITKLLMIIFIIILLIWPVSFLRIYTNSNTRFKASEWINNNIPTNSTLAIEHWDDALPILGREKYNSEILELYNHDSFSKWQRINEQLLTSDYIIIASNRLYVPIIKLNDCNQFPKKCYPVTSKYYQKLFSGELGFSKVAEFSSYPSIPFINISINDQDADESFTVYDHPKIMIFKKTRSTLLYIN